MNLLVDPVFRVQIREEQKTLSLPSLLEVLGRDLVESLPGLQRHQEDAFHIFLCYLAGAVLARRGRTDPCQSEDFWREGIREITGRPDDLAWTLVVDDPTRPAFMQPAVPSKEFFTRFQPKAYTPDELDLLATAKNHDVKGSRCADPLPENWIYALVSLQTMCGYFGHGDYGISRMNQGSGSRPRVRLEYAMRFGKNYCDDIQRLLCTRSALLNGSWHYRNDGLVATWAVPWDLVSSIELKTLDPFFIEIARAVRLARGAAESLFALAASSKAARIAAKELKGLVGDPWIPVDVKKEAALGLSGRGFTPKRLHSLIFEEGYKLQAMQRPIPGRERDACDLHATVLVRGQGTTDGFQEAIVRIPGKIGAVLFRPTQERKVLADRSKIALNDSSEMQTRVLARAVFSLLEAGPEAINFDKREIAAWADRATEDYARHWEPEFFPWLWRSVDVSSAEAARLDWLRALREIAWTSLQEAVMRFPARQGRRLRARVRAEGVFYRCLHNTFPQLMEEAHGHKPNARSAEG